MRMQVCVKSPHFFCPMAFSFAVPEAFTLFFQLLAGNPCQVMQLPQHLTFLGADRKNTGTSSRNVLVFMLEADPFPIFFCEVFKQGSSTCPQELFFSSFCALLPRKSLISLSSTEERRTFAKPHHKQAKSITIQSKMSSSRGRGVWREGFPLRQASENRESKAQAYNDLLSSYVCKGNIE